MTAFLTTPARADDVMPAVTMSNAVPYGPLPAEQGDLFVPASTAPRLHAAILVIHGGGWISGRRSMAAGLSAMIARRGFVVFNIDYRLAETAKPDTHWPAQLVDAQLAVRWLRANAVALQIDPGRIGAIGDSAGGTLAVFLGALDHPVPGDQAHRLAQEPSNVAAVADQFGVMSLDHLGEGSEVMVENLFGNRTPPQGQLDAVSPLPAVSGKSAPMLVVHGDHDDFVPLAQSRDLVRALQAAGVPAQLIVYSGGHGFAGMKPNDLMVLFGQEIDWLSQRLQD